MRKMEKNFNFNSFSGLGSVRTIRDRYYCHYITIDIAIVDNNNLNFFQFFFFAVRFATSSADASLRGLHGSMFILDENDRRKYIGQVLI